MRPARNQGAPLLVVTPNYRLRSMKASDAGEALIRWLKDPEILAGLNIPEVRWTAEALSRFILGFDNSSRYLIGLVDVSNDAMIGFYTLDVDLTHRVAQMTAAIGEKQYWGRNVLIETTPPLVRHLFDYRKVDKVVSRIVAGNNRILFQFLRSDVFAFEARLRQEVLMPSRKRADILVFSALKQA